MARTDDDYRLWSWGSTNEPVDATPDGYDPPHPEELLDWMYDEAGHFDEIRRLSLYLRDELVRRLRERGVNAVSRNRRKPGLTLRRQIEYASTYIDDIFPPDPPLPDVIAGMHRAIDELVDAVAEDMGASDRPCLVDLPVICRRAFFFEAAFTVRREGIA